MTKIDKTTTLEGVGSTVGLASLGIDIDDLLHKAKAATEAIFEVEKCLRQKDDGLWGLAFRARCDLGIIEDRVLREKGIRGG